MSMKRKNVMHIIILLDIVILLSVVASASASLGIHSNFPSLHISPLLDNFQQGCQCTFIIYPGTGTISSALSNTKDGDIWVLLKGTYYDNVVINKSISINGAGPDSTFVDGTGFPRSVFTIEPTKTVALAAMTIQNGVGTKNNQAYHAGGGIYNGGTLTLDHVVVSDNDNKSTNIGGGIYNGGTINLNNVLITNNEAMYGAGVYNDGSGGTAIVNMNRCSSITGNKAWSGSGIYNSGTINLNKGSTITNNTAIWGGGISNDGAGGAGHTTIVDMNKGSTIAYNTAYNDGGGIYNSGDSGTVTINMKQGSSITGNIADYYGGGIFNDGQHGTATINMKRGSSITYNTAKNPKPSGGGVYSTNNGGTATVNQKPCSSIICNTPDNIAS